MTEGNSRKTSEYVYVIGICGMCNTHYTRAVPLDAVKNFLSFKPPPLNNALMEVRKEIGIHNAQCHENQAVTDVITAYGRPS